MVKKKRKSKRCTLKDKYKVQHRVVEHHRKIRKQAKRDAKAGIIRHDKKKKDPGIPNSWPFKNELLNGIERARELAEKAKLGQKQNKSAKNLDELMARANAEKETFQVKANSTSMQSDGMKTHKLLTGQQSRRAYLSTLRKVIDLSDIVLQVLDARDPLGTRIHKSIEETILNNYDKKMVLVLNKIDLIPKGAVSGWLNILRRSRPTVAIKCGTNIHDRVGRSEGEGALTSSCGVGIDGLLGLLKNYSRTTGGGKKTCITIGIIGYPNVGKSSIVNTLKRSRAVGVSSRPGFTTSMQEVVLDTNLRLIDSPGVVFDDAETVNGSDMILRNCINADSIEDPIPVIEALLKRCTPESLMMTYSIPAFPIDDAMIFLAMVAKRNGKIKKGGIPDKVMAARGVLKDWNTGKIPFYTKPPTEKEYLGKKGLLAIDDAKIVSSFGNEFDVAQLDSEVMQSLEGNDELDYVQMAPNCDETNHVSKSIESTVSYLNSEQMNEVENMILDDRRADSDEHQQTSTTTKNDMIAEAEDYDFNCMT